MSGTAEAPPCRPRIYSYMAGTQRMWCVSCRKHRRALESHTWSEAVRLLVVHHNVWRYVESGTSVHIDQEAP